jgi:hypothetical protein
VNEDDSDLSHDDGNKPQAAGRGERYHSVSRYYASWAGHSSALSSPFAYDDPQAVRLRPNLVLALALLANQTLYIILGDIVKGTTGSYDGDTGNSSESLKGGPHLESSGRGGEGGVYSRDEELGRRRRETGDGRMLRRAGSTDPRLDYLSVQ